MGLNNTMTLGAAIEASGNHALASSFEKKRANFDPQCRVVYVAAVNGESKEALLAGTWMLWAHHGGICRYYDGYSGNQADVLRPLSITCAPKRKLAP